MTTSVGSAMARATACASGRSAAAAGRPAGVFKCWVAMAVASRLRGELEQALSHFQRTKPLVDPSSARRQEVDQAIAELVPLVRERERERMERRRGPRRGASLGALRP